MLTGSERDELMDMIIQLSANADGEVDQERIDRLQAALGRVTEKHRALVGLQVHDEILVDPYGGRKAEAKEALDRAEREYLSAHGWTPDYKTGRWTPPKDYRKSAENPDGVYTTTRHAVNSQRKRLMQDRQTAKMLEFSSRYGKTAAQIAEIARRGGYVQTLHGRTHSFVQQASMAHVGHALSADLVVTVDYEGVERRLARDHVEQLREQYPDIDKWLKIVSTDDGRHEFSTQPLGEFGHPPQATEPRFKPEKTTREKQIEKYRKIYKGPKP